MKTCSDKICTFVRSFASLALASILCLAAFSCYDGGGSGSGGAAAAPANLNHPTARVVHVATNGIGQDPATGLHFFVDANRSGQASEINLLGAFWGRLVDIYDFNPATSETTRQFKDCVIGENIDSDIIDYRLDRNSITDAETLTILHPAGSAAYLAAFQRIELQVQSVNPNGVNPPATANLSAIPRNAALVLKFDDLLDSSRITPENVSVLTGYPPIQPYAARVIPNSSHGDLFDADGDGIAEFHSTRIVVDLRVSQSEAQLSSPPLPINSLGLQEATVADQPNVILRVPTQTAAMVGQLGILTNLRGFGIGFKFNTPNDPESVTLDVVRSMRSSSADLQDPNHGFLPDSLAPRVIGVQGVNVLSVLPVGGTHFLFDALFDASVCAPQPRVGDELRIGAAVIAVVTQAGSAPSGGLITGVSVRLEVGSAANFLPGPAEYRMPFDPSIGLPPDCFVRFSPTPTQLPSQGVAPDSTITVRFSEPMDPASVSGLESLAVTRVTNASPIQLLGKTIVGTVQPSPDLREFTYTPVLPFERNPLSFPAGEEYKLALLGGPNGVHSLSGQPLADSLPAFNFRLDPAALAFGSRGFVFNFNSADQDGNGAPELRGQFLFDLSKGTIRPRPVTRFSAVADSSQPVVGLMIPFTGPVQTPLSNLGSKMMSVYRYHDLGLGLVDDSTLNIDVEGLSWAPSIAPQVDTFSHFRMAFCHSKFLPDEALDAFSLLPSFPSSGLVKTFDGNQVDPVLDPLKIVHPKSKGYSVQPLDSFVSSTGTLMMPYPLNRGLPHSQFIRYTFRDTGLLAVGGPNGSGVETDINGIALGIPSVKFYGPNKVPSLGLPLLMEFRCYPDTGAFGLNGFKVDLALNSSARPAFRAFSTGGVLATGALYKVNPDEQPNATGGITAGGLPTGPGSEIDPMFYLGQADFVVRVNRVHTVWLDTLQFTAQFQPPIVEPPKSLQPPGTEVIVALRGALTVTNGAPSPGGALPRNDATRYDPYGDPKAAAVSPPLPFINFTEVFPLDQNGLPDKTWKTNMALLNSGPGGTAPRFVQARITMFSNPNTLRVPEISAMGIALKY